MRIKRGQSAATVVAYATGRSILQGSAPAWQAAYDALNGALASMGGMPAPSGTEELLDQSQTIDPNKPHIGTDEAGKGDYFGPLVSAAVFVDTDLANQFRKLGVRDSKKLSDKRVIELAAAIKQVAEGRYAVTPINPPKYNDLYQQFKREKQNLNALLAWGHAKSIDRLLNAPAGRQVNPEYVLIDQFADEHHVEDRSKRVTIPIYQRPKAEDDIAVAAASILARESFLIWLEKWSIRTTIKLPKGASEQVIHAAKQFVSKWGRQALGDVAKLNFRTTTQVLDGDNPHAEHGKPPWAAE
jgi:ribonuclease HIII